MQKLWDWPCPSPFVSAWPSENSLDLTECFFFLSSNIRNYFRILNTVSHWLSSDCTLSLSFAYPFACRKCFMSTDPPRLYHFTQEKSTNFCNCDHNTRRTLMHGNFSVFIFCSLFSCNLWICILSFAVVIVVPSRMNSTTYSMWRFWNIIYNNACTLLMALNQQKRGSRHLWMMMMMMCTNHDKMQCFNLFISGIVQSDLGAQQHRKTTTTTMHVGRCTIWRRL